MFPKQITADAKHNWMSKFSCKKEEYQNETGRATYIHKSADSLSFEIDWMNKNDQQFPDSKSYQNFTSFPMCTFACKKHDDQIFSSFATDSPRANKDHSFQTTIEHMADVSSKSVQEGYKTLIPSTIPTDETHHEILSPSVQLLHEIHLQKGSSGTNDIIISDHSRFWTHSKNEVDQNEFTIYRQRMRYEAIKEELFDDSTLETIDQETIEDYENEYFYGDEYLVTSEALDKVGCQAASLWSCIPNISKLFVPNLREGELLEDDSISEGDTEDASFSSNTDEISDNCANKHTFSIRLPDEEFSPDTCEKSRDSTSLLEDSVRHEGSSYAGSYMDQSHIYLMMTNARQERSAISLSQSEKTREMSCSRILKGSDLDRSNILNSKKKNEMTRQLGQINPASDASRNYIDSWWGHKAFITSTFPDPSQRWIKQFHKRIFANEFHDSDTDFVQKRWLYLISQTLEGDSSPYKTSSNQKERCEAAQGALQRISAKLRSY